MSTTAENFRRADEIFRAAAKLDPPDRDRFINERSGGDERLLAQLRDLLRADQVASGVLDQPALGASLSRVASSARVDGSLPQRIGPYRVIRVIGEGGMGIVYEAEQENPRRRVALKVIRPGMMSATLLRRFRHEAQMLGQLTHPGIAQIYQAGTADQGEGGQPYFAMELVSGRPLVEYAETHARGTRQRLDLMARICDAVHHAHLNGVIHRDLKPTHIIVAGEAPEGQPKILDFGIARATEVDIQTVTLRTDIGQLLGTIAYMSPEQAAGDPSQLDIRSDVYALGVIAYELLSGRLPYDVHGKLIHEAVRVIRENEPSRLSSISRVFRGDVETIIAKALEKDKDRRYSSAAEFAADIRRHLSEQPIAARPASRFYQLRKFARRNKAIVGGVAVAFAALTMGTAVAVRQAIVAERARVEEHRLRGEAEHQAYRASLVAGSAALRHHEINDAQRHLAAAPERLRGWEWDHLNSRIDDSLATLSFGFFPTCMALSPDGRLVASCSSSGHIQTWQVPELTLLASRALTGSVQERRVARLVFSPDGRELRADTMAGSVRLDARSLEHAANDRLFFLERSADNRFGATILTREQRQLVIVEIATGREIFRRSCRDAFDPLIEFSPGNEHVAVGFRDGGLTIHRISDGALLCSRPDLDQLVDLAFTTDGLRAAAASMNGAAQVIDAATGDDLAVLSGHAVSVTATGFSPDDTLVATASNDHTVRLWRASDGSPVALMHGTQANVIDLAFTPDGSQVVTASDGGLRWWDATGSLDPLVFPAPGTVYGLAFSPDGGKLAAVCLGGAQPLRIWDMTTRREVLAGLDGYLSALAFSADGSRLVIGRSRGSSLVVDARDATILNSVGGRNWRTDWAGITGDHSQIVSLGNNGRLVAVDAATGAALRRSSFPGDPDGHGCRAAVSPDGALLAVAARREIHILDASTWDELHVLRGHTGSIYALTFSADGARMVSGGTDRTLRVWDVRARAMLATMTGHSEVIFAAAFNSDGSRIVSGGRDRVIRVWDAHRYEEITQLHGHTSLVYCLAFSPDGTILASGAGDDTVRLWDTKPSRDWLRR